MPIVTSMAPTKTSPPTFKLNRCWTRLRSLIHVLSWPRHMFARILDRMFQVPWHTSALNLLTCSLVPWPTSVAVLTSVLLLAIALSTQRWKMVQCADLMALLFSMALMLQILIIPSPLRKCQTLDHGDRPTSFRNE